MATTKKNSKVVDRWDAVAISKVTLSPEGKKFRDEWNTKNGGKGGAKKPAAKPTTKKK